MATAPDSLEAVLQRAIARLLRWFFHHLYTDLAWAYDAVAWVVSFGAWSAWRRIGLAALPPTGRHVEIGCGTGRLAAEAVAAGRDVFAVDASAQMTRRTARRMRAAGGPARVVRARVQAMPFMEAAFPAVLATFPSEYIVDPAAATEIRRLLSPGGQLVVVLSAWIRPRRLWERFARWLFSISGQAPLASPAWLAPLQAAGIHAKFETGHRPDAEVLVIRGSV